MIRTSALRDHPEDIPILASFFWNEITKDSKSKLPPKIISELKSYGWPGNARELKAILSNLHILFGKENLKLQHLRLVFHIGGQNVHPASEHAPKSEIHSHRVECFRHLKRVDETLHACKVAMEPLLERKAPDKEQVDLISTSLRRRLNELELLCSRPLLFHTESTFAVVYRVKGKCAYFLSKLSTDVDQAAHFWRKELADELQLAVSTIFKEVERLLP
jgi:DNA-binding NtrC family response regulator